jgi:hypothetical protein
MKDAEMARSIGGGWDEQPVDDGGVAVVREEWRRSSNSERSEGLARSYLTLDREFAGPSFLTAEW